MSPTPPNVPEDAQNPAVKAALKAAKEAVRKRLKNRRQRESRTRRNRIGGRAAILISTEPIDRRALKKSARKARRCEVAPYKWIIPWVRDPHFRYQERDYPRASLMGLPAELRQVILYLSLGSQGNWAEGEQIGMWMSPGTIRELRKAKIVKWTGDLSCVSPLIRLDMLFVGRQWKKEWANGQIAPAYPSISLPQWKIEKASFQPLAEAYLEKKLTVQGVKRRKKRAWRPQKCWYCEERHKDGDPVCPMSRKDPLRWRMTTKTLKARSGKPPCNVFRSKKVVFEEDNVKDVRKEGSGLLQRSLTMNQRT